MREVEMPLIMLALQAVGGNQMQAARMLGINRNTLRKKMLALGLPSSR
jgi:two-component system nitrogen regulation response regulator GlnG